MKIDLNNTERMYFSIKEVAVHFGVNASLLRYWESQFDTLKPHKTDTGIRQYTRQDIEDITLVYNLVKERGLTLEGAQQVLKQNMDGETRSVQVIQCLERIRDELKSLENELDI